ncbi:uncharacterized protein CTRU02_210110 [Colletotrichum truncatum]|uniref:Uncharacterized protein n=1 Tax=Colletotrichum truncatum TaxID=5467 RepID=A0ACC3YUB6_COLTU|nr:uncharacterized protein CTRU02_02686 [Colletotrichum truncatum]KAF6798712.1 hypothetical protein CTRU02_02686 [Colletotrichum truncatum]
MKFTASQVYIAIMAATALALPVDVDQHPMASDIAHGSPPAKIATKQVAPLPAAPAKVESSSSTTSESDDLLSALKAIFSDEEKMHKEGLGKACFCANGSICCNTAKGIDCTQGLCGI